MEERWRRGGGKVDEKVEKRWRIGGREGGEEVEKRWRRGARKRRGFEATTLKVLAGYRESADPVICDETSRQTSALRIAPWLQPLH